MNSIERLLNRPRATASVTLAYDPDAATALADARSRRLLEGANDELDTAIAEMETALVTITFALKSVGVSAVDDIIKANWDAEKDQPNASFLPALLAATCTSITLSDAPDEPAVDTAAAVMAEVLERVALSDQEKLSSAALALDRRASMVEAD